jgi:hypothetical protein
MELATSIFREKEEDWILKMEVASSTGNTGTYLPIHTES